MVEEIIIDSSVLVSAFVEVDEFRPAARSIGLQQGPRRSDAGYAVSMQAD